MPPVGRCRAILHPTLVGRPAALRRSSPVFCVYWWVYSHLRIPELLLLWLLLLRQLLLKLLVLPLLLLLLMQQLL